MTAFSITGLEVDRAGIPIIRGVDVAAKGGEISVLLGSNGAGKTTFLEGLSGIIPVRAGSISLDGTELARLRRGRRIGG